MTEYGRIHTDGSRSGGQPAAYSVVLAPCPVPWCGSSDVKARSFDANHRRHWVECRKCNFKTLQMPSKTKVIALWNTRQPTQSDALREAVIEECAKALEADARLCDCAALEERECACGAWDDYKSITSARAVEIVRALAIEPCQAQATKP